MKETFGKNDCGRGEQLVGYLYDDDARVDERADFEQHLGACAACRDELAAFGQVRLSVTDLRSELLHAAPAVSLASVTGGTASQATPHVSQTAHASQTASAVLTESEGFRNFVAPRERARPSARSARAALREFFALSPAWLRVSAVAASLAVCALALLAVANAEVSLGDGGFAFRTGLRPAAARADAAPAPVPNAAPAADESAALRAQLNRLASERDAAVRDLEDTRAQLDDSRAVNLVAAEFEGDTPRRETTAGGEHTRQRRSGASPTKRAAQRNRSQRRAAEEDDLPRLLDLLGDAN